MGFKSEGIESRIGWEAAAMETMNEQSSWASPVATRGWAIGVRLAVFASLWSILAEGTTDSWLLGIPVVLAATVASFRLQPTSVPPLRLASALHLGLFFVARSLEAGVDVARRAVSMNIAPQTISYGTLLKHESARVLFAGCVSLMPGTLTMALEGSRLRIHTLDSRGPVVAELSRLERRIAAVFDEKPPAEKPI